MTLATTMKCEQVITLETSGTRDDMHIVNVVIKCLQFALKMRKYKSFLHEMMPRFFTSVNFKRNYVLALT